MSKIKQILNHFYKILILISMQTKATIEYFVSLSIYSSPIFNMTNPFFLFSSINL